MKNRDKSGKIREHREKRWTQLGNPGETVFPRIFLDIDEPYTLRLILSALHGLPYEVTLGPCEGLDPVVPPPGHFQFSEYERVDWEGVSAGRVATSNYCVRKGISRRAQLAVYAGRHVAKRPACALGRG